MPPKKKDNEPKKKTTVVDKTFGMKNKKGGAAQKQIQQINAQAKAKAEAAKSKNAKEEEARKAKLEADKKAKKADMELLKPVQVQKVPFGVDPKTVLCVFFKQGHCEKGRKCKFSHDPNVERKAAKKDLYTDSRDEKAEEEEKKKKDNMIDWDEDKLRSVVLSKHGNPRTTTDKVCKYFIEAVENQKYGWFWTCPNGGDKCMYKHSLPPGFILKTKEQRAAEKALKDKSPLNTLTLEDWLESERHKLTGTLTPVNPETFAAWKKGRLEKKAAEHEAQKAKDATGRELWLDGKWAEDDSEPEEGEDEDGTWNLAAMRRETERLRAQKEEERLIKLNGGVVPTATPDAVG